MKARLPLLTSVFFFTACQPFTTDVSTASPLPPASTSTLSRPTATLIPLATASPTPPWLQVSPRDGMPQLFVPAGSVQMGGVDVYAENDENPAHIVHLDAFWIDQVEVTNGMYQLCVEAGVCLPPVKLNSDNRAAYYGSPEFQDYPVVHVTWLDAKTYCAWTGRRLPTEAEWERAARGDDLRTYPWGDEPPSAATVNFNNEVGDTSRVGSYQAGAGPFGALDMAGNVWEWAADLYRWNYYTTSPDTNPSGPPETSGLLTRVIRGGSFQDARVNIRVSNRGYELGPGTIAGSQGPASSARSSVRIGFRCAVDN